MSENVTPIKKEKTTQIFSFEVVMLCHIIADDEKTAKEQLDANGGLFTKRDVELLSAVPLFGEEK